jgi:hypothetical protein
MPPHGDSARRPPHQPTKTGTRNPASQTACEGRRRQPQADLATPRRKNPTRLEKGTDLSGSRARFAGGGPARGARPGGRGGGRRAAPCSRGMDSVTGRGRWRKRLHRNGLRRSTLRHASRKMHYVNPAARASLSRGRTVPGRSGNGSLSGTLSGSRRRAAPEGRPDSRLRAGYSARARAALLAAGGADRWPWLLEGHGRPARWAHRPPSGVLAVLGAWDPARTGWWEVAGRIEAERPTVARAAALVRAARRDPRDRPTAAALARELARAVDRWRLEAGYSAAEAAPSVVQALELLARWAHSEVGANAGAARDSAPPRNSC